MKDELAPVTADEFLVRLVWKHMYKAGRSVPVSPDAFRPKRNETDGISVFRASCLSRPEQALDAMSADNRGSYAVVTLQVADVVALGLTVVPAKIEMTFLDTRYFPNSTSRTFSRRAGKTCG